MLLQSLLSYFPKVLTQEQLASLPETFQAKTELLHIRCGCGKPSCTEVEAQHVITAPPVVLNDGTTIISGMPVNHLLAHSLVPEELRRAANQTVSFLALKTAQETTKTGARVFLLTPGSSLTSEQAGVLARSMLALFGLDTNTSSNEFNQAVMSVVGAPFSAVARQILESTSADGPKMIAQLEDLAKTIQKTEEPKAPRPHTGVGDFVMNPPLSPNDTFNRALQLSIPSVLPEGVTWLDGSYLKWGTETPLGVLTFGTVTHNGEQYAIQAPAQALVRLHQVRTSNDPNEQQSLTKMRATALRNGHRLILEADCPLAVAKVLPVQADGSPAFAGCSIDEVEAIFRMDEPLTQELRTIISRAKAMEAQAELVLYRQGRILLDLTLRHAQEANIPVVEVLRANNEGAKSPFTAPNATTIDVVIGDVQGPDGTVYGVHFSLDLFFLTRNPSEIEDDNPSCINEISFVRRNEDGTYNGVSFAELIEMGDTQVLNQISSITKDFFMLNHPLSGWRAMLQKFDDEVLAENDPVFQFALSGAPSAEPVAV